MKIRITAAILAFVSLLASGSGAAHRMLHSSQPIWVRTGAPSESTCGSCHTNSGGNVSNSFAFSGANNRYSPGETDTVTVQVTGSTSRYGFEMTALTTAGYLAAGSFTALNTANTSTGYLSSRYYVGHRNANTTNTWKFLWHAPVTNVGSVRFYLIGMAANGNNSTSGDSWVTSNYLVTADSTASNVQPPVASTFSTRLLPSGPNQVNLEVAASEPGMALVAVYDLNGRKVLSLENQALHGGLNDLRLPLRQALVPGLYLLHLEVGKYQFSGEFPVL